MSQGVQSPKLPVQAFVVQIDQASREANGPLIQELLKLEQQVLRLRLSILPMLITPERQDEFKSRLYVSLYGKMKRLEDLLEIHSSSSLPIRGLEGKMEEIALSVRQIFAEAEALFPSRSGNNSLNRPGQPSPKKQNLAGKS